MPATIPLRVLAAVLLVLTGALINTLGAKVAEKTRCFRACGLDKKMSLTKPPQVLNSVLCNRCLRRRSAKHTFVEKTIFQRRKRSTFSNNCPGKVNESTPVPEEQYPSRPFVAIRRYEDTDNWFADVSWDPLNDPYKYLKGHLIKLSVGPGPDIFCIVLPKNQTSLRINISQYGYHYPDYIELGILSIPHNLRGLALEKYDNPSPSSESSPTTSTKTETATTATKATTATTTTTTKTTTTAKTTGASTTSDEITKVSTLFKSSSATTAQGTLSNKDNNKAIKYVFISAGILVGLLVGILVIIFRRKFVSRPMEHISISAGSRITLSSSSGSEEKELDSPGVESYVFIMFNERDCKWMKNKLLHLLEKQHKLKCRVHYRDFYPGRVFYETMSESVYASYKNIVVYSKNFLKSTNCCYELEQAEQRLLSENDNSLVIIRIDDADLQELPRTLQNRSVIDYDSNHEKPYWEKKLLQFLKVPVAVRSERKIATVMTGRPAASEAKNALAITRYNRLDSTKSDDTVISSV